MDANKGNINLILNGEKQFIVPVYQRTYSWRYEQCNRLWNDIVNMQKNKKEGHFVGSIVNIGENVTPTDVQKFLLIDGQQRLTTLTLLLIALRNYIINESLYDSKNESTAEDVINLIEDTRKKIEQHYAFNPRINIVLLS